MIKSSNKTNNDFIFPHFPVWGSLPVALSLVKVFWTYMMLRIIALVLSLVTLVASLQWRNCSKLSLFFHFCILLVFHRETDGLGVLYLSNGKLRHVQGPCPGLTNSDYVISEKMRHAQWMPIWLRHTKIKWDMRNVCLSNYVIPIRIEACSVYDYMVRLYQWNMRHAQCMPITLELETCTVYGIPIRVETCTVYAYHIRVESCTVYV